MEHNMAQPVDHSNMDHSNMDHSNMDHSLMNHSGHHMMMEATTGTGGMDHGSHGGHSSHGDSADMGHGMMMYFHLGVDETILFSGWKTGSWQTMLASCVGIFLMAALYEGLKVLREYILRRSVVRVRYHSMPVATTEDTTVTETHKTAQPKMCSLSHLIQTLLHILQVIVSYFLMLIFMTYNVWLCLAVALGAGTGYFLFSWRRAVVVDINEHCH